MTVEEKQKIKEKLEQEKNYILEELATLKSDNFEEVLKNQGYVYYENATEKEKLRKHEIYRRESWLNNSAPIARLVRPGEVLFDHFSYRNVKEVRGFKYNFVDLYLDGSALFERAYTSGYFYEDDTWEFFREL